MEAFGNWAEPISVFSFFLLAKASGGFRTIGLLPDLYRVWAKLRMALVHEWYAKVPRQFFAAGPGKSIEDAVGRVLLAGVHLNFDQEAAAFYPGHR